MGNDLIIINGQRFFKRGTGMDIKQGIARLIDKKSFSSDEMEKIMHQIMTGEATPAQIAGFLVALRLKGETVDEITAAAFVMREHASRIHIKLAQGEHLVDTCGTGGDRSGTFNVSTTAAFVVAGAGVKVAKHGNRSVSSLSGSADVLENLGINLNISPESVANAINDIGIGFLFAPTFHPAMKHAIMPRREIGIRTIFNILGPLCNPAGADVQIVGVYEHSLTKTLAEVLGKLGAKRAWVVHGGGGLDEISLLGATKVSEWDGLHVNDFIVRPEDLGMAICDIDDITGGTAADNAKMLKQILTGEKGHKRNMVALNAGAAIFLAGKAISLPEGVEMAFQSIDSGRAYEKLEQLVKFTQNPS